MRISDWSSDVCSSDQGGDRRRARRGGHRRPAAQGHGTLPAQSHPPGGRRRRGPARRASGRRQGPGGGPGNGLSLPRHRLLAADDRHGQAGRRPRRRSQAAMTRRRLTLDTPTGPVTVTAEDGAIIGVTWTSPTGRSPASGSHDGSAERKSVVEGKTVSVRVEPGGRRIIKKTRTTKNHAER